MISIDGGSLREVLIIIKWSILISEDFYERNMPTRGSGFRIVHSTDLVLITWYLRNSLPVRVVKLEGGILSDVFLENKRV